MFTPNFEAISHVTLVLGPENRPESLSKKAVSFKNGLSTAKNVSPGYRNFPLIIPPKLLYHGIITRIELP